ncbi:hypothetical protein [Oceanitalea stevensii]|uniref:PD40 domain-containing protein n=1 Tax=Oceanitalea stevensii TaxID=2763072 RepID=A0ABR8Z565_9MICO|nr:hypothetical protein [Oceanitalea stevensii]MBD8063490.1 PD40 domain-containing protein [Oceanitalea stevensii]
MRRAVVASAAGLGVVGSLLAPAALPLASPASGVVTQFLPPTAEQPRLVFAGETSAASADSAADLWDVPAAGGAPRRLVDTSTAGDGPLGDTHPSYSPDGTRVVLTAAAGDEPEAGSLLHVADLTTGEPTADPFAEAEPLDTGWEPGLVDSEPDWSPEGDRIVFTRTDPEGGGPRLRVLDLETATVTDPLEAVGADVIAVSPAWSPDGTGILLVVPGEGDVGEIWLLDEEGAELRPLAEETEDGLEPLVGQGPAWSPDGTQLTYVDAASGALVTAVLEEPAGTPGTPVVVEPVPLYEPPDGAGALTNLRDPSWSPDGTEVTVAAFEEPTGKDPAGLGLFAIPVAGGDYRTVVGPGAWADLTGPDHQPWSNLAVTLESSRTTGIGLGELVELTTTVTNPGPSTAWGVSVEYELPGGPEGMETAVGWPPECSGDGGYLTCTLDEPLAAGETVELTVTVAVPEPGSYRTDVRVDALTPDPATTDNVAAVALDAPFPPAVGTEPRLAFSYRHSTAEDRRADVADVLAADASDFRILVDEVVDDGETVARPVEEQPSYSPDGRRLVLSSERHELDDGELPDQPTLFVADVGPAGAQNIEVLGPTDEPGVSATRPSWSPDRTRIAYLRGEGEGAPTLAVLHLESGTVQDWEVPATDVSWSPDSTRLVVTSPVLDEFRPQRLTVVHADDGAAYDVMVEQPGCTGGPESCFAPVASGDSAWAPESARIAYTASAGEGVDGLYTVTLGDLTAMGEEQVYLVPPPQLVSTNPGDYPELREPTWALDGSSVTVVGQGESGEGQLLSAPADGGTLTLLRELPGVAPDAGDPVYQPWADVGVELAVTSPVDAGQPATVTATVTNLGPSPAWEVEVGVDLPAVAAGQATLEGWPAQCTPDAAGLTCVVPGTLPAGETVTLPVELRAVAPGGHPVRAAGTTASVDPEPGNDVAVATLEVEPAPPPVLEPHLAFTRWADRAGGDDSADLADVPTQGAEHARLLVHRAVTTDGGQLVHLEERHPAYSPDGTRIALSTEQVVDGTLSGDLRLAVGDIAPEPVPAGDPLVTGVRLLGYVTEPGQSDLAPVWSPDGTQIAFTRQDSLYGINPRVLVLDVDTGATRELALPEDVGSGAADPSWAPDGQRLVVAVDGYRTENEELWVVHLDDGSWYPAGTPAAGCSGAPVECVEPVAAVAPAWSPDGAQVAAGDATVFGDAPEYSAVVVHDFAPEPVDGFYAVSASRVLAGRPADAEGEQPPGTLEAAWHPAWSPDGTEVAFVGRVAGEQWPALYAVPAGGGTPEVRVDEWGEDAPGGYGDPAYQPWSDVGVTLRPAAGPVVAGTPAELTAVVTSGGPSPAWGLTVTFTLPPGQRVVDAPAGCSVSGASATCTQAGPLAPGADLELTFTVVFDEPGEHEVTGTVTAGTLDPVPGNDTASTVVVVEARVPGTGVEPRLAFGYVPDLGSELPSDLADVFWADGEEFRVLADERPTDPLGQEHRAHETHPSYSPDGRRLAFAADRELVADGTVGSSYSLEGRQRLMVGTTQAGETGLVAVTPLDYDRDPAASDEEPAWSPDGTRLAFVRSFSEGSSLALVDLASGDVRLLDAGLPGGVTAPTWSPDGERLAVEAGGQLWVVDVDGEEASPVVVVPETCPGPTGSCDQSLTGWMPAWSPDGTRLAFVAFEDDFSWEALYTVEVAGEPEGGAYRVAEPLRVAGPGDQSWTPADPDWSLDGSSIAVVGRGAGDDGADALLSVPATGGEPVVLRDGVVPGLRHGFADLDHQPWADLGVVVTASDTEVDVGEQVDMTVTATNHGPSPAWGVLLDVALPGGGEHLVSVPAGCAATATGLQCTAPQTLPVDATYTVTVPLAIGAAGSHVTRATVTSRMIDPLAENDTAEAAVEVVAPPRVTVVADVAVRVDLGQPTAWVGGDPVAARLVVTNDASGPATGVRLTFAHPDAVTADGPDACLAAAPCALGTLAPGASRTVVVALEPVTAGTGPVTATVTTTALDLNPANDSDAAELTVLQPALRLLPSVGEPGEATLAYGTDFPPGARLTLSWAPGLTAWVRPVTVAEDGTVRSPLLVLPGDLLGERVATATWESGPGFGDVAAPAMLVVPETSAPPDFLTRG